MDNRRQPHWYQPHWLRRAWQNFKETVVVWRAPGIAGIIGTVGSWTVWYYSSVPCTVMAAMAGRCNPGVFASYITLPVLTSCLGIGAGCVAIVGGYNVVMLNRERQRADAAEERAILAQDRAVEAQERANQIADEVRERMFQMEEQRREDHLQFMAERREEHRQAAEECRQMEQQRLLMDQERREEHRQFMATQQAMLDAITQMVQRQKGRPSHGVGDARDANDAHNPQQQ